MVPRCAVGIIPARCPAPVQRRLTSRSGILPLQLVVRKQNDVTLLLVASPAHPTPRVSRVERE